MSTRKGFFIVMITFIISMSLFGSSVSADTINTRSEIPERGNEITIANMSFDEKLPSVAFNRKHNEYLVVWQINWPATPRQILGARISNTGNVLETFAISFSLLRDSAQPDVAYDPVNDRYLVVFIYDTVGNGTNWDLRGRFIPWDGPTASLNEFVICDWNNHQWNPKVVYARAMEEFLVAWNNEDQSHALKANVGLQRVKASDGSLLSDLTIYHPTNAEERTNVDVAYNLSRNEYLVVYDNIYDILATRYTGDLSHDFVGEFSIAGWPSTENKPAVAACMDADQYMVTWQSDQTPGPQNYAIYGRFIGGNGEHNGPVKLIDDTTSSEQEADVTCNDAGTQYLVAWQTVYTNSCWGIWGRLVNPQGPLDGTLEQSFSIVEPYSNKDRTNVALAGGKITYLAVWEHDLGTSWDIHGRMMIAGEKTYLPLIQR